MQIVRRLLLATALAISAMFVIPAGPASAAGQEIRVCFQVGEIGGRPIFDCYTIVVPDLAPKPPWPPTCLSCPGTIVLWDDLDLVSRYDFVKELGRGLQFLGKAELSGKPEEVKKLRELAAQSFLTSAAALDGAEVKLENVGWADLKNGKFYQDPTGNPALKATGEDIVQGLGLMQLALNDPEPQPNLEAAMAEFDQAYGDIATLYGG